MKTIRFGSADFSIKFKFPNGLTQPDAPGQTSAWRVKSNTPATLIFRMAKAFHKGLEVMLSVVRDLAFSGDPFGRGMVASVTSQMEGHLLGASQNSPHALYIGRSGVLSIDDVSKKGGLSAAPLVVDARAKPGHDDH